MCVSWFACGWGARAVMIRGMEVLELNPEVRELSGWYRIVGESKRAGRFSGREYPLYDIRLGDGVRLYDVNSASGVVVELTENLRMDIPQSPRDWSQINAPRELVALVWPGVAESLDAMAAPV